MDEKKQETFLEKQEALLKVLKAIFGKYEAAFQSKNSEAEKKYLPEVLGALQTLGYSRNSLAAALALDTLTIHRWQSGSGMKDHTFANLQLLVDGILNGKPQHPIRVSDTGLVSWEYVFQWRQPLAEWIWYITEERFLLTRIRAVRERVRDLFVAAKQDERAEQLNQIWRVIPKMIYVFPENSQADASLQEWLNALNMIRQEHNDEPDYLRGTIIGLRITDLRTLPWFLPGTRMVILNIDEKLEGYMRLRLPKENEMAVLKAMAAEDAEIEERPWLSLHREPTDFCYTLLEERYLRRVKEICIAQKQREDSFHSQIISIEPSPVFQDVLRDYGNGAGV